MITLTDKELLEYASQEEGFLFASESDYLSIAHIVLEQINLKLQAENEQLRKDAERYGFLRNKAKANNSEPFICIFYGNSGFSQWDGESADEAIDKAMAETK